MRSLARPLLVSMVLGFASAVGDWIWARFLPDGAIGPAIAHGVALFALMAWVVGWAVRAPGAVRRLLATLPPIGLFLAAVFYPVAAVLGYLGALLATWLGMWMALAWLTEWARSGVRPRWLALLRGLLAGAASGLSFWAVSGMWTDPAFDAGYVLRFVLWTVAFLPGFAVLLALPGPGNQLGRELPGGR